jgi:hypothetical protein
VLKDIAPVAGDAGLGDRTNMVFSGTAAIEGSGNMRYAQTSLTHAPTRRAPSTVSFITHGSGARSASRWRCTSP